MRVLPLPEIFKFIEEEKLSVEINPSVFSALSVHLYNFENIIEIDYKIKDAFFSENFFDLKEDVYQTYKLKSTVILNSFFNRKLILQNRVYSIPLREILTTDTDSFFYRFEIQEKFSDKIALLSNFDQLSSLEHVTFFARKSFVLKDGDSLVTTKVFSTK